MISCHSHLSYIASPGRELMADSHSAKAISDKYAISKKKKWLAEDPYSVESWYPLLETETFKTKARLRVLIVFLSVTPLFSSLE